MVSSVTADKEVVVAPLLKVWRSAAVILEAPGSMPITDSDVSP
ncbi:hypothetical protein [Mesorhizobium tamadayense]|nr:hypothetical protein [Mesorhizobium tamadayense]